MLPEFSLPTVMDGIQILLFSLNVDGRQVSRLGCLAPHGGCGLSPTGTMPAAQSCPSGQSSATMSLRRQIRICEVKCIHVIFFVLPQTGLGPDQEIRRGLGGRLRPEHGRSACLLYAV